MPYSSNSGLPKSVRAAIPSGEGQSLFRRVVNSQMEAGKSETIAFASAWAALQRAGYKKDDDGNWVKKNLPSSSSVHVPSAEWDETDKAAKDKALRSKMEAHNEKNGDKPGRRVTMAMLREVYDRGVGAYRTNPSSVRPSVNSEDQWAMARVNSFLADVAAGRVKEGGKHDTDLMPKANPLSTKKADSYTLPESARNNARKVLEWREKYGDEVKGMTQVGWRRARQLANNKTVGAETVKAMAQFNRHRKNAEVAAEYKDEPWKDAGYVAWLGWGGTSGITNWAVPLSEKISKYQVSDDQFSTRDEAVARSIDLGLDGAVHVHDVEGQAVFMPGASHEQYIRQIGDNAGIDSPRQTDGNMLERAIRAILSVVIGKRSEPVAGTASIEAQILKADDEQRMVWGWASVVSENGEPVFDKQGDYISTDVLTKAATEFMLDVRVAKAMHDGDQVGEVVHSFPFTNELGDLLGMSSDREGWVIAMKVHDDDVWARVKSGELGAFSIGGEAVRNAV